MTTTSKKSTTRKSASTPVKKTKKRAAAKPAQRKNDTMQSFKLSKSDTPFMTFSPTKQTLYWTIFGIVVVTFSLWIFKIQADVNAIYDQIDQSIMSTESTSSEE